MRSLTRPRRDRLRPLLAGAAVCFVCAILPALPAAASPATPVYVTLFSHNEEGGYWAQLAGNESTYRQYRENLVQKVLLVEQYGAAFDWQTSIDVLRAMGKWENSSLFTSTNGKNIVRWMKEDKGVRIDTHTHAVNSADVAHELRGLGVEPTGVIGGFELFEPSGKRGVFKQTPLNSQAGLNIDADGKIRGRIHPESVLLPKIVVLPAMVGHVYDGFESGVWRPAKDDYYVHDPGGSLIAIGSGYAPAANTIGPKNSGGSTIWYRGGEYIKELVGKIDSGELNRGKIYTASVAMIDMPIAPGGTDTYRGLKETLDALVELQKTGDIVYADYEKIAALWQEKYKGEPNIVSFKTFSRYPQYWEEVQKICWDAKPGACGDGVCDDHERSNGVCREDCGTAAGESPAGARQPTVPPSAGGQPNQRLCGDGVCDETERSKGVCAEDCQSTSGRQRVDQGAAAPRATMNNLINQKLCGDGVCDEIEKSKGVCPADCANSAAAPAAPQGRGGASPVPADDKGLYVYFVVNVSDFLDADASAETLKRLLAVHERYRVKADFYFTETVLRAINTLHPEVVQSIRNSPLISINYHYRPPHPAYSSGAGFVTRVDYQGKCVDIRALPYDDKVAVLKNFEQYAQVVDGYAGVQNNYCSKYDTAQVGGFDYVRQVFGKTPVVCGGNTADDEVRRAEYEVLKNKGLKAYVKNHVGGMDETTAFRESYGLLERPADQGFVLDRTSMLQGAADVGALLEAARSFPVRRPVYFAFLTHDYSFYKTLGWDEKGSTVVAAGERERFYAIYENLVRDVASNGSVTIINADDLVRLARQR